MNDTYHEATMPATAKQPKEARTPALSRIDPARLPGLFNPAHTGKLARGDARLVRAIADALEAGSSDRSISERHHVAKETVSLIATQLEQEGRLRPLKQRLSTKLGQAMDVWSDDLVESISNGKKKLTAYDFGILYDRKVHMDGEPSLRVDVEVHGPRLDELTKLLTGPVVDVECVSQAQVTITDVVGLNSGQTLPSVSGQAGGRGPETAGGHEDGDGI